MLLLREIACGVLPVKLKYHEVGLDESFQASLSPDSLAEGFSNVTQGMSLRKGSRCFQILEVPITLT